MVLLKIIRLILRIVVTLLILSVGFWSWVIFTENGHTLMNSLGLTSTEIIGIVVITLCAITMYWLLFSETMREICGDKRK